MYLQVLRNVTLPLALLLVANVLQVYAQYYGSNGYQGNHYQHPGDSVEYEQEQEERPRVQLGFRLRVPALKFELPRMNLPKITISAKIRQPDGPRTINLPEINLDTSSRLSPSGAAGGLHIDNGGGREGPRKVNHHKKAPTYYGRSAYAASASEQNAHHQLPMKNEQENTFTFSAEEEVSRTAPQNGAKQKLVYHNQVQETPDDALRSASSSSQTAHHNEYRQTPTKISGFNVPFEQQVVTKQAGQNLMQMKDIDSGFSSPVYLEQSNNQLYYVNDNYQNYPQKLVSSAMKQHALNQQATHESQTHNGLFKRFRKAIKRPLNE